MSYLSQLILSFFSHQFILVICVIIVFFISIMFIFLFLKNLNFSFNFGVILLATLIFLLITGSLSVLFYSSNLDLSFTTLIPVGFNNFLSFNFDFNYSIIVNQLLELISDLDKQQIILVICVIVYFFIISVIIIFLLLKLIYAIFIRFLRILNFLTSSILCFYNERRLIIFSVFVFFSFPIILACVTILVISYWQLTSPFSWILIAALSIFIKVISLLIYKFRHTLYDRLFTLYGKFNHICNFIINHKHYFRVKLIVAFLNLIVLVLIYFLPYRFILMCILGSINVILVTIARSFRVVETHDRLKKTPVWNFRSILEAIFNFKPSGGFKSSIRGVLYSAGFFGGFFEMGTSWDSDSCRYTDTSWDSDTSWNTDISWYTDTSWNNIPHSEIETTPESAVSAPSWNNIPHSEIETTPESAVSAKPEVDTTPDNVPTTQKDSLQFGFVTTLGNVPTIQGEKDSIQFGVDATPDVIRAAQKVKPTTYLPYPHQVNEPVRKALHHTLYTEQERDLFKSEKWTIYFNPDYFNKALLDDYSDKLNFHRDRVCAQSEEPWQALSLDPVPSTSTTPVPNEDSSNSSTTKKKGCCPIQ